MSKDHKGVPAQKGGDNLRGAFRQNSENFGRPEQNPWAPPHLVSVTRAHSGSYLPQGVPSHQAYVQNIAQASFAGGSFLSRYPSWSSISAPPQGNHAIRAPIPIATSGRAGSLGQPGGPPFSRGDFYAPAPFGVQRGAPASYSLGIAPPQTDGRMPTVIMALNVVSVVVVLLHIPACLVYGPTMKNYAFVLGLAPLGVALGFAAVYSPACDCATDAEVAARRIRLFSSAAAVVDAVAVIFVPLAMIDVAEDEEEEEELEEEEVPLKDSASIVLALVALLHLLLCLVVRIRSRFLARRSETEAAGSVPGHLSLTGQMRSFSGPPRPPL